MYGWSYNSDKARNVQQRPSGSQGLNIYWPVTEKLLTPATDVLGKNNLVKEILLGISFLTMGPFNVLQ